MKDATPIMPPTHEWNSIFKTKQHRIHDPRGPEKYNRNMSPLLAMWFHEPINAETPSSRDVNKEL